MSVRYPWYDAWWLDRFARAKEYLALTQREKVDAFGAALAPLRTRADFEIVRDDKLIGAGELQRIRDAVKAIRPAQLESHELARHGRFVIHDHPMLVDLHRQVAPIVSELAGERLDPAYSFIALYNRNGRCPVHLDAPVSKWTLDFCIEQSEPWPIAFSEVVDWPESFETTDDWEAQVRSRSAHRFSSVSMSPGEAVFFSGSSQWHFRDPIPDTGPRGHCDLLFFHFIPAGMQRLADWKNWEATFAAPGLTSAIR